MSKKKTQRPTRPQAPRTAQQPARRPLWLYLAVAAGIVAAGVVYIGLSRDGAPTESPAANVGLPSTSDYHSLLVSPTKPDELILGTHQGLYRSVDGGRRWASYRLPGQDAMNLARGTGRSTLWTAGHDVLARSDDGGRSWQQLRPASLPSLDLHGFAVDPRHPATVYAAVAGVGLFRSADGGATFSERSREVGANVLALAVTPQGEILAGDAQRGLLASRDGGRTWREALSAQLAGLAINPKDARIVLATGAGILRSTDGGKRWSQVLRLEAGVGPVAWSPSSPKIAYAVGFDRSLYRSRDSGASWSPVGTGG